MQDWTGPRIVALRNVLRLTQDELAKKLGKGVSRDRIANYEKAASIPSLAAAALQLFVNSQNDPQDVQRRTDERLAKRNIRMSNDNSLGLGHPSVKAKEIETILRKYAIQNKDNGFTEAAVLFPGGQTILATQDKATGAMIEDVIANSQFIEHVNFLIDLQGKMNERKHEAGAILEIPILCEQLTFVLNLFGRKSAETGNYFFTEIVIPIVVTRSYRGGIVQQNSVRMIAELRALALSKKNDKS